MQRRVARSRAELLQVLRDRRDELNISHSLIDALGGLPDGYAGKLLAPEPVRGLGPMSLGTLLGALGLGIVEVTIVEDPAQIEAMRDRWRPRKRKRRGCVVSDDQAALNLAQQDDEERSP
jgi:hypothetical protein